jgi:hypothetical protein
MFEEFELPIEEIAQMVIGLPIVNRDLSRAVPPPQPWNHDGV